jgi:arylsulfatase A-like enzyme
MMARGRSRIRMEKALVQTLTRRQFLKAAGTGAAGMALLGSGALAGCDLTERIRNNSPGGEPGANVVMLIIDSLRKDHIGAYGNDWIKTPNLDALAKESLRFTRSYPESAPTICARRAIHTGTRTWPFKDWYVPQGETVALQGWQPIPNGQTTLAEMMRAAGYGTYFVTDNLQQYKPAYNMHRGFDAFDFFRGQTTDKYKPLWTCPPEDIQRTLISDATSSTGGIPYFRQYFANVQHRQTEEDWFAPQVFTRASEVLETVSEGGPFFLTVDAYDPHAPWDPPEEYANLYSDGYEGQEPFAPVYGPSDYLTEEQLKRMNALYSAETTMMDRWLGHFLDKMEELNLFENTLVVLLSDHGILLGDHGSVGKPHSQLYPGLIDVPFLIRHPEGRAAGETSDYFASTHDVAPTILGFLGAEQPEQVEGADLSVILDGGEPEQERDHFTLGYDDHVWTRDDRYVRFGHNNGTQAKLFDILEDPEMNNDLAAQRPDIAKRMFDEYVLGDAGGPLPTY